MNQIDNNILNNNLNLIKKYQPKLYKLINNHEQTKDLINTKNNLKTYSISSKNKKFFIHSKYDPLKETERFLKSIKLNNNDLLIFYKPGLGYSLDYVTKKFNVYFIIIEPDLTELKTFFTNYKLPDNDKWYVLSNFNILNFKNIFISKFNILFINNITHIISPVIKNNFENIYIKYKNIITDCIDSAVSRAITLANTGKKLQKNIINNLKYFFTQSKFISLANLFSNIPVVIVGAGPSLKNELPLLKKYQNNILIIATDTAYSILLNNNINPHFTVTIDPNEYSIEHFKKHNIIDQFFITELTANHNVINKLGNNKLFYFTSSHPLSLYFEKFIKPIGLLSTAGGSVSTLCLQIATVLNCNPIILIGQDLSYPNYNSHCKGSSYEKNNMHNLSKFLSLETLFFSSISNKVIMENISQDSKVISDYKLLEYKKWFEEYIKNINQKIDIYNCTSEGAFIKNSKHESFIKILKKYCKNSIDNITSKINVIYATNKINYNHKKYIRNYYNELKQFEKQLINLKNINNFSTLFELFNNNIEIYDTIEIVLYSSIFKEIRSNLNLKNSEKINIYKTGILESIKYCKKLLKNYLL